MISGNGIREGWSRFDYRVLHQISHCRSYVIRFFRTAKGHSFIALEDEASQANLIIRPKLYKKHRDTLRQATVLAAAGKPQREQGACSVLVFEVWEVAG